MTLLVLVDTNNRKIGLCEKMEAHQKGLLHRAFSVFVYNTKGEMLLQQRALCKYHAGGLWTNTVCSHPYPGEKTKVAAKRRLQEEMGFCCEIDRVGSFVYRAEVGGGLVEHEHDTVFIGQWDGVPLPNPTEVMDYRWITPQKVQEEIATTPQQFTPWFLEIMKKGIIFNE